MLQAKQSETWIAWFNIAVLLNIVPSMLHKARCHSAPSLRRERAHQWPAEEEIPWSAYMSIPYVRRVRAVGLADCQSKHACQQSMLSWCSRSVTYCSRSHIFMR